MASGSFTGTTSSSTITPKIDWSSVPDTENNTSQVTAALYIYKNQPYAYRTYGTGTWTLTIDGNTTSATAYHEFYSSAGWVAVIAHTFTVAHDADGTKSINISASGGISGTSYTSTTIGATVTLDAIPRASTVALDKSTADFGDTVTATITPAVETFSHAVTWSLGANSSERTLAAGVTQDAFTIPTAWAASVPNAASAAVTCTVTTYNGGTEIGSKSANVTATVPASAVPTLSGLAASVVDGAWGLYVQGKSKASVAFNDAAGIL